MSEKRNVDAAFFANSKSSEPVRALYTNQEYERDANNVLKPLEGLSNEEVSLVIVDRLRRAIEIFITKRAANYGQMQSLMAAFQAHHNK